MLREKKTAKEWFEYHRKKQILYRSFFWLFKRSAASEQKITEQEYIDIYIHPDERWKI